MARDPGLEALVEEELGNLPGLTGKGMFGGWAWMLNGHLLCAARKRGILARLGPGNDAWALRLPGITPMIMHNRIMGGWINADTAVIANDDMRRRLLFAAVEFVRSLPPK